MLNKLFGKKKEDNYFLEFDIKDKSPTQKNPQKNQVAENTGSSETMLMEKTTVTENSSPTKDKAETKTTSPAKTPTTPQPQSNVSYDPPEWVKAIKNYSTPTNNNSPYNSDNFAGNYVSNNVPMSRRRPGPSLNKFKQMAGKMGK